MPEKSAAPGVKASVIPSACSIGSSDSPTENLKRGMVTAPGDAPVPARIVASWSAVSPC
jgi:hypothetical protein